MIYCPKNDYLLHPSHDSAWVEPKKPLEWCGESLKHAHLIKVNPSQLWLRYPVDFSLLRPHIDLCYAIEKIDGTIFHYHDTLNLVSFTLPTHYSQVFFSVKLGRIASSGIFKLRSGKINKPRLIPSQDEIGCINLTTFWEPTYNVKWKVCWFC